MPIDISELTDKQSLEILSYKEGHFVDVKAKEIKPGKLTKALSAFAKIAHHFFCRSISRVHC